MKVKFLIDTENHGNIDEWVYAFFPEEKYNDRPNVFTCYAHVGQHSGCDIGYANGCQEATPEQYADLLNELKQIYDNLEII